MALGLAGLLAGRASALPPRQHPLRGAVQTVGNHQLTLRAVRAAEADARPLVFSDQTRFYENGKRTSAAALRAGQRVNLYYRHEPGRAFITEARWRTDGSPLPAAGQGDSGSTPQTMPTHSGIQL